MNNIKSVFILILGLILFTSCDCIEGEGPIVTETRILSDFDAIEIETSADVILSKSDQFGIEIKGQQNILDILRTRLRGRTLVIDYEELCVTNTRKLEIHISMPELTEVQLQGSGDIQSDDAFTMDDLILGVSGSGSIDMEVNAGSVEAEINGSGNIYLEGETNWFRSAIRGSGDIRASRLKASQVKIRIAGSGNTYIHAVDELDVSISGSGDVSYSGNPAITTKASGSGSIRRIR